MISSGSLSDKATRSKVNDDGSCDSECPFFSPDKKHDILFGATCLKTKKVIIYSDGFLAHCNEAYHVAARQKK